MPVMALGNSVEIAKALDCHVVSLLAMTYQ